MNPSAGAIVHNLEAESESDERREKPTARVFFALWPDRRARSLLDSAAKLLHKSCGGRRADPENIHLTLVFLGNVDRARLDLLKTVAAGVKAQRFQIDLTDFGFFRHNKVAWAGTKETPLALSDLVNALEQGLATLGFAFDRRPFSLHITLLRKAACREATTLPETIQWRVDEFVLVESELSRKGATYQIIGRWPLAC